MKLNPDLQQEKKNQVDSFKDLLNSVSIITSIQNEESSTQWLSMMMENLALLEDDYSELVTSLVISINKALINSLTEIDHLSDTESDNITPAYTFLFTAAKEVFKKKPKTDSDQKLLEWQIMYGWLMTQIAHYISITNRQRINDKKIWRALKRSVNITKTENKLPPKPKKEEALPIKEEPIISIGEFTLYSSHVMSSKGKKVKFTPRESQFLQLLMNNADTVVSGETIRAHWQTWREMEGKGDQEIASTWHANFRLLRKKILKKLKKLGIPDLAIDYYTSQGFILFKMFFLDPQAKRPEKKLVVTNEYVVSPKREVTYKDKTVRLSPKEYLLLKILKDNARQAVPTEKIREIIYKNHTSSDKVIAADLSNTKARLQYKLSTLGLPRDVITSVRKDGITLYLDSEQLKML